VRIKQTLSIIVIIGFVIFISSNFLSAIDAPHNESNNVYCGSCHGQTVLDSSPFWGGTTSYDQLCLKCHMAECGPYHDLNSPREETHSSANTSTRHGTWARECRNCHDPHYQLQKNYKNTDANRLYLASGTITSCGYTPPNPEQGETIGKSTLTYSTISYKSGWDATKLTQKTSNYRRTILFPNINKLGYNYPIIALDTPTDNSIVVKGNACTYLYPPTNFAALYGQYIKDVIDISSNGSGVNKPIKFFDHTGTNSFADGDNTYNGVCEACHTDTTHYTKDGSGSDQHHTNIGGEDGKNCISCHSHLDGFKASCNGCHYYPPPPLASIPHSTGSTTAGQHALHATTKGYQCSTCHYNSVGSGSTHNDNKITLGFVNLLGSHTGGSYDGQTTANYESSDPGTTVSKTGQKKCSNLYCHGGTMAPDGGTASAIWDDPSSAACNTCHGASTSNPPIRGSHAKHAGSALQLPCSDCHKGYVPATIPSGMDTHVNNQANFAFDTSKSYISTSASYNGTTTMLDAYGQCSNVTCHGSSTPTWGGASIGCDGCHKASNILQGKHSVHYATATVATSGSAVNNSSGTTYIYNCGVCHDPGATAHARGVKSGTQAAEVAFDETVAGGGTYTPGGTVAGNDNGFNWTAGTCTITYCHSPGTKLSSPYDPPNVTSFTWNSGTIQCNGCHGNPPFYNNGNPKANSHAKHTTNCSVCHYSTTITGNTITNTTNHINKSYTLQAKTGYTFTYSYSASGGTCSNISCHFNGSAQWGTTTLSCSSCHAFPPATGAHLAHIQSAVSQVYGSTEVLSTSASYAFGCGNCHPVSAASHGNGTVDISLNPLDGGILKTKNDLTAYRAGTGGSTVCYKIYCHSNGASGTGSNLATAASPAWGSPLTGNKCGACHGNPPQYVSAGAGIAGANSHYNTSGFMGKEGGHMVTIHFDNVYNKVTGSGLLSTGTTVDSSHGNASVATTMACYVCHSGVVSNTTIDTYAMSGTSSSFRCNACHTGATPTPLQTGVIADKSKHVSGSVTVAFAPITMNSKAQLRDASMPSGWTRSGTYGASGSYDSASTLLNAGTWTPANKTCTVVCHNNSAVQWGDTTVTCLNCHNKL
jgi:predicted CxxxxCH...CXXCH cytochrome family protein